MEELHDFAAALTHIKAGGGARRVGWEYTVWLVQAERPVLCGVTAGAEPLPWMIDQTDVMAEDWILVPGITRRSDAPPE